MAGVLQAEVSALRKTIQSYPMVPMLKGIVSHYREDKQWLEMRPPFESMPQAEAAKAVARLEAEHNFKIEIGISV